MGGEPPIDRWTTIDETLKAIRDSVDSIRSEIGAGSGGSGQNGGVQQPSVGSGSSSQKFITFPKFGDIPDDMVNTSVRQIAGLIPNGNTTLNFVDGRVEREGVPNGQMSGALASIDSDYVRSLDIYCDAPFRMKVHDTQGQTGVGFFDNNFREVELRNVEVKGVDVIVDEPAVMVAVASTKPDPGLDTSCGPIDKTRVAVDSNDDSDRTISIDDSWGILNWSTQENVISSFSDSNMSSSHVAIPGDSSPVIQARNSGTFDMAVAVRVNVGKYQWAGGIRTGTAYLDGWTLDSPGVVGASDTRLLDISETFSGGMSNVSRVEVLVKQPEVSGQVTEGEFVLGAD